VDLLATVDVATGQTLSPKNVDFGEVVFLRLKNHFFVVLYEISAVRD